MFIRFVSGQIDEYSHVLTGVFSAAYELWEKDEVPEYELEALEDMQAWFNLNLWSPFDFLPRSEMYDRAICWFKPTAREHIARAWQLASILERNDVFIWVIKSPRTGYVYYEDEEQVFAEPFSDERFRLKRLRL